MDQWVTKILKSFPYSYLNDINKKVKIKAEYFSEPKTSQIVPKMSQNLRPPTPETIIKSYDLVVRKFVRVRVCEVWVVSREGLEPSTSGLWDQRSNQLSYLDMVKRGWHYIVIKLIFWLIMVPFSKHEKKLKNIEYNRLNFCRFFLDFWAVFV